MTEELELLLICKGQPLIGIVEETKSTSQENLFLGIICWVTFFVWKRLFDYLNS